MIYSYPFFSFPHFRRYTSYYPTSYGYMNQPDVSRKQERTFYNNSLLHTSKSYINNLKKDDYLKKPLDLKRLNFAEQEKCSDAKKERNSSKRIPTGFSFLNNLLHQEDRSSDEAYFDLFGLKLYNDDILIIGLIFFLYKEDVKDQYLFLALILLLLS